MGTMCFRPAGCRELRCVRAGKPGRQLHGRAPVRPAALQQVREGGRQGGQRCNSTGQEGGRFQRQAPLAGDMRLDLRSARAAAMTRPQAQLQWRDPPPAARLPRSPKVRAVHTHAAARPPAPAWGSFPRRGRPQPRCPAPRAPPRRRRRPPAARTPPRAAAPEPSRRACPPAHGAAPYKAGALKVARESQLLRIGAVAMAPAAARLRQQGGARAWSVSLDTLRAFARANPKSVILM